MEIRDKIISLNGILHLRALDPKGKELWRSAENNLIVVGGYEAAAQALAGIAGAKIQQVAVGTNGTAPTGSDISITNPVVVQVQSVEYPAVGTVRFNFMLEYADAVGMSIREFGLFTADGRLFSRKVRQPIEKTAQMSIVGAWEINM